VLEAKREIPDDGLETADNNPKQERGFLVCPGDFIVDSVKGVGGRAAGAFIPIP
jgi:hypothetical protein